MAGNLLLLIKLNQIIETLYFFLQIVNLTVEECYVAGVHNFISTVSRYESFVKLDGEFLPIFVSISQFGDVVGEIDEDGLSLKILFAPLDEVLFGHIFGEVL